MQILPSPRRTILQRSALVPLVALGALALLLLFDGAARAQVAGSIVVYPETSSLEFNTTRQFVAYVPISPNTITWLVNDVPGGSTALGTISATGLYTPPAVIPAANVVTIKARSTAFPSSAGTASLTITRPYPWLWSASPSKISTGNYRLTFNGSNFASDSQALANGVAVSTTFVSPTSLIVNGAAADALQRVFAGDRVGTVFAPATRMRGKRRWLAYAAGSALVGLVIGATLAGALHLGSRVRRR